VNLKGIQLSLIAVLLLAEPVLAAEGKISLTGGYFGISAKANGTTSSIGNPSAFRIGYQYPILDKFELAAGYSILMADFSGSDLGYGLDLGANYYPLTFSHEERVQDPHFEVKRYQEYSPFVGLGFYQRQFQSVKNSYAGLGATIGLEKYYNKKINLKAEARYITLGGSGDSSATEINFLLGIVYKL
jgi:hypothetical protein